MALALGRTVLAAVLVAGLGAAAPSPPDAVTSSDAVPARWARARALCVGQRCDRSDPTLVSFAGAGDDALAWGGDPPDALAASPPPPLAPVVVAWMVPLPSSAPSLRTASILDLAPKTSPP